MNKKDILDSIGYVDADLICEAEDNSPVRKRKNAVKWISAAACLCIAVAAAVILSSGNNSFTLKKSAASEKADSNEKTVIEDNLTDVTAPDLLVTDSDASPEKEEDGPEQNGTVVFPADVSPAKKASDVKSTDEAVNSAEKSTEKGIVNESADGGAYSCGGAFVPAVPKNKIKVNGEKLTDAEGAKYLEENKGSLVSSLSSSGVKTDNVRICDSGYGHISYDGSTLEYLNYNQNFRDYIVYNGNDIIAIVTLWKENGKIYSSPAFGAPWFKDYVSFLRAHKGQSLLYVYAGYVEIIITPDGKAYNPQGLDVSVYLEGIDNPYNYFYSEGAVYTP